MALKATSEMASKTKNKKQKGMYSEKNLRKRLELMDHPGILALLERLWVSANTDASDAIIDHDEYIVMHRKSERHSSHLHLISISPHARLVHATLHASTDTHPHRRPCVCRSPARPRPHHPTIRRITPGRGRLENRL